MENETVLFNAVFFGNANYDHIAFLISKLNLQLRRENYSRRAVTVNK